MKQNKIIVCIATDDMERIAMVKRVLVKKGIANTPGDAGKVIKPSPNDYDLADCYFVAASLYNMAGSQMITHQLYRLAASGVLVVVGAKKLQSHYEFMCEPYYQGQI